MITFNNSIILIPARLAAVRLPNKPLADIHGIPMVLHVATRAKQANIAEVVIACADQEIADVVTNAGFRSVLTDPALPSGTDRIHAALSQIDPEKNYQYIMNVQGDQPTIDPTILPKAFHLLSNTSTDIGTLVAPMTDPTTIANPNVVKAVLSLRPSTEEARALYFTRAQAPYGEGTYYYHIGVYSYKRNALDRFVTLAPTPLELRERLEQLRAMEHGMTIDAAIVSTIPVSVDTPEDLEKAKKHLAEAIFATS